MVAAPPAETAPAIECTLLEIHSHGWDAEAVLAHRDSGHHLEAVPILLLMVTGQADMDPLRTARATPPKAAILRELPLALATPKKAIVHELLMALATPKTVIVHELPMALVIQTAIPRELLNMALAIYEELLNMVLATAQKASLRELLNMALAALAATDPHPPHTTGSEGYH
jgi:hypothetical protein